MWNISKLDSLLSRVLKDKIPGVNTSYLYFGMWRTFFGWYTPTNTTSCHPIDKFLSRFHTNREQAPSSAISSFFVLQCLA